LTLQPLLPDNALRIVARGEGKEDPAATQLSLLLFAVDFSP
jgi:hypothetical protein